MDNETSKPAPKTIYRACACTETAHDKVYGFASVYACRNCGTRRTLKRRKVRCFGDAYLVIAGARCMCNPCLRIRVSDRIHNETRRSR